MGRKPRGYWTYETCWEEAKKYHSRWEFSKGSAGAYIVAKNNNWLDNYVWFKTFCEIITIWNYDTCFEEAKKYTNRSEFRKGSAGAYTAALKNKWLDDYDWMKPIIKPSGYWNYDTCYEEAKKYHGRDEFQRRSAGAYTVARKNGWLDDYDWFERKNNPYRNNIHNVYAYIFEDFHAVYVGLTDNLERRNWQHIKKGNSAVHKFAEEHGIPIPQMTILEENISIDDSLIKEDYYVKKYKEEGWNVLNKGKTGLGSGSLGMTRIKWTKNKCYEEAKKFHSRGEFSKGNERPYQIALRNGWLDDYTWFEEKIKPKGYWNIKENCHKESQNYQSRSEFAKHNNWVYQISLRNGWMDEFFPIINKAV